MDVSSAKKRARQTLRREQEALKNLEKTLSGDFFRAVGTIANRQGKIVVTGVGKSAFVGMKMTATFTSLGHFAIFLHPVDALHGDLGMVSKHDVLIALSFSGESREVVRVAKYLKEHFDIPVITITGKERSSLGNIADSRIVLHVDEEGCPLGLAPMASTTATLVAGDLIASALTSPEEFAPHDFARFHPGGNLGLRLKVVSQVMREGEEVPLVESDAILKEAIHEISKKRMGIVGVVRKEKLIGVLSDGDVRRIVAERGTIEGMKVSDGMTPNPKTIAASSSLEEALFAMEEHRITSLFVLDKQRKPAGVVHMHDIVQETL